MQPKRRSERGKKKDRTGTVIQAVIKCYSAEGNCKGKQALAEKAGVMAKKLSLRRWRGSASPI